MDRVADAGTDARLAALEERLTNLERVVTLMTKKSLSPDETSELLGLPKKGT